MSKSTLYDSVSAGLVLYPATKTADVTTCDAWVDTMGFNSALFIIQSGNGTFSDETYAFQAVESAAASGGGTAISGKTASITADNQVKYIRVDDLLNRLRYLSVTLDVGGSSPSCPLSVVCVLGDALSHPVNS